MAMDKPTRSNQMTPLHFLPLILIPICALFNHWAGQATFVPNPRLIFRGIAIPAVITILSYLRLPIDKVAIVGLISLSGMALWWIPGWASGFCCISPYGDGRQQTVLSSIVNKIMGVSYTDKLTPSQCHEWGWIYFTLRGLYIYPLFAALGFLTPWAYTIGFISSFMGICYGTSKLVSSAEWKMGAVIGAMLAGVLLLA
jgi:hypothetical protein